MDYTEYLELLINNIANKPKEHRQTLLKEIMRVDRWVMINQKGKGWAVNLYDGLLLFWFDDDTSGNIYYEWDLNIRNESEIPENFKDTFILLGTFSAPPAFEIKLKK